MDGLVALNSVEGLRDYEGYFVDVLGNVFSTKSKRLKKLSPGKKKGEGYLFVVLTDCRGRKKSWSVHQLVARAFIGLPKEGEEVNHLNRNSLDNRVTNLEWCSRGDNMAHCKSTGGTKLDHKVTQKAKELHARLQKMGHQMPDLHCFINAIVEGEIDRLNSEYS